MLNLGSILRSVGAVVTPRQIAKSVLTDEGRQAIRALSETSQLTSKSIQALTAFTALTAVDAAG